MLCGATATFDRHTVWQIREPHLVQQVCQGLRHALMSHVEVDQSQVSAVRVQVVEALLVEAAAQLLTLGSIHRPRLTQRVLQLPQGRQDVLAERLTHTQEHTGHRPTGQRRTRAHNEFYSRRSEECREGNNAPLLSCLKEAQTKGTFPSRWRSWQPVGDSCGVTYQSWGGKTALHILYRTTPTARLLQSNKGATAWHVKWPK